MVEVVPAAGASSPFRYGPFVALLVASVGVFFGFSLLVAVVPLWVVDHGAGELAAGAATGVFMAATVLAQLLMPRLVGRYGYRATFVAGAVLLGGPVPVLLVATDWAPVLGLSFLRGLGFGIVTVCGSALVAELLPAGSHGRGAGLYGVAVGIPLLVGLPLSTWAVDQVGFLPVFLGGAVLPLLGIPALALLPRLYGTERAAEPPVRATAAAIWRPWLPMFSGSVAFGALVTFVPLMFAEDPVAASAALLLMSGMALATRWLTGVVGDRRAVPGRWLLAGLLLTGIGLLGVALIGSPVLAVVCVALYGAGFGAVQNESLVMMFRRVSAARASVAWNVAFDAGQGLGAVVVGALAALSSYAVAFGALAVLALVLLPVARMTAN